MPTGAFGSPKYIVNFSTKRHWKGKSRLEDIQAGLTALHDDLVRLGIKSIAVPPLGCGNGGLDWGDVRPLIERALGELQGVEVLAYVPEGSPAPQEMVVGTRRPRLTRARALIVALMDAYSWPGYRLSILELEKLAYFLHRVGALPSLKFVKGTYGPYAKALHHMLQDLEGHYIRGLGDRTGGAEVVPLPEMLSRIHDYLDAHSDAHPQFTRVAELISGYETPYSMELLATVDWVARENPAARLDIEAAVEAVHTWNERKRRVFKAEHIRTAWRHLHRLGMLEDSQAATLPLPLTQTG